MFIIIAGAGRVGYNLAKGLLAEGHEIALVEKDKTRYQILADEFGESVIYGDASDAFTLKQTGANRSDLLVATAGNDEDNLIICQMAKIVYMVPRTLARVNDPKNEPIFTKLGIDQIVNTTNIISALIGHKVGAGFLSELLSFQNAEIVQIEVPENSPVIGKPVKDLALPKDTLLIASIRNEQVSVLKGDSTIQAKDTLIALTNKAGEETLRTLI
jgi:trk system potassium uptake protein TrkA